MEVVIFCGIQGSGKSSFFLENYFDTHVHISLDVLKTRHRENQLINKCLELSQSVVIDNTNPSLLDRAKYISVAKKYKAKLIGYYFESAIDACLKRNALRSPNKIIPEIGVRGTRNKLELPQYSEGFDELYFVRITEKGFEIRGWESEI